jgi:hypothetical protein
MRVLIVSGGHGLSPKAVPEAAVIEPSMPGCPHYLSRWLAQRVGHGRIMNAVRALRSDIDLLFAQLQGVIDLCCCRSDGLFYHEFMAEGCVNRLRGNPR